MSRCPTPSRVDIIRLTLPPQYEPDYVLGLGCLVGSAEQSLLALDLPDGEYMSRSVRASGRSRS
jgi:hypothetical protein